MANILDYLRWRSDLTLWQYPLCEVDNLVLSQLANLRWEKILQTDEQPTLGDLWPRIEGCDFVQGITANDDRQLLSLTSQSERFRHTCVCDYVHTPNEQEDKAFSAVTFLLCDDSVFVSFRGREGKQMGWKEDFDFCLPTPTPSQLQAQRYLRNMLEAFPTYPFYVGGYSKGGNLALYAAATLPGKMQHRLKAVYSYDAPGLSDTIFLSENYKRLELILHAFVPQSSIIGMVLTHPNVYTVVRSNSISVLQQNPYTWQVEQRKFVREKKLHSSSVYIERVLKKWLSEMDDDHRRGFVKSLFDVLESTEAKTFGKDFWMVILHNPKEIIATIKGIDSNTRQMLTATILAIANVATQYLEPQGEENEKISRMEDKKNG